jgi:hypothetical protein
VELTATLGVYSQLPNLDLSAYRPLCWSRVCIRYPSNCKDVPKIRTGLFFLWLIELFRNPVGDLLTSDSRWVQCVAVAPSHENLSTTLSFPSFRRGLSVS